MPEENLNIKTLPTSRASISLVHWKLNNRHAKFFVFWLLSFISENQYRWIFVFLIPLSKYYSHHFAISRPPTRPWLWLAWQTQLWPGSSIWPLRPAAATWPRGARSAAAASSWPAETISRRPVPAAAAAKKKKKKLLPSPGEMRLGAAEWWRRGGWGCRSRGPAPRRLIHGRAFPSGRQ